MEGADGGDGEGLLEVVEADVGEGGGGPRHRVVGVVDEHFDEAEREHPLERLFDAPRVGAVDSDREYLRLLLPRYLIRKSRQPACTYIPCACSLTKSSQ